MSDLSSPSRPRRFALGAPEPRIVLGLGGVELGALGACFALALLIANAAHSTFGVGVAAALVMIGASVAWVPIAGRSAAQWMIVTLHSATARVLGAHRWRHDSPALGAVQRVGQLGQVIDGERPAPGLGLPVELARLDLLESSLFEHDGPRVGVFADRQAGTYSGALLVRASANFGLQSHTTQESDLEQFGLVLTNLARDRSPLRRLAWIERTLPEPTEGLMDDLVASKSDELGWEDPAVASYVELIRDAGRQADEHELVFVAQVSATAARRIGRRRGWSGEEAVIRVLMDELRALASELDNAGLEVRRPLSARGLTMAVRTGLDPWSRSALERLFGDERAGDGPPNAEQLAPTARRDEWGRVIVDGSQHAVLWISQWPRTSKGAAFLAPLLVASGVTRTVAVVMELVGPRRGMRQAESQVSSNESAEDLRAEHGKRTTRRVRRRAQADARREGELAEGQVDVRFCGYIGVSAPGTSHRRLEEAVDVVTRRATACGLTVERLWGAQAQGLTFLLPTGRGLK